MPRKKMFVSLPQGFAKIERIEIRATSEELSKLQKLAANRQMPLSEFLRRAGLGRATPVDFETDLIVGLSDAVRAIRDLHRAYLDAGIEPPEEFLLPLLNAAKNSIVRIGDSK